MSARLGAKDFSEIIKNWIDIAKSALLVILFLVIIYFVLLDRARLKGFANEMGIETASVMGVQVKLQAAADALPQSQAVLQNADAQVTALSDELKNAMHALEISRAALAKSSSSSASAAERSAAEVLYRAPATLEAAQATTKIINEAQTQTARAISNLPNVRDGSLGFAIVFGGHKDLDQNRAHLKLANNIEGGTLHIVRRADIFRTIMVFPNKPAAEEALPKIRQINKWTASAYIVTMASWCPNADLSRDPGSC